MMEKHEITPIIAHLQNLTQGDAMIVSIQLPNFTQTPNVIYDYWMPRLSGSEFKVLSCMCRETFGYQCREITNKDYCSIECISTKTGLNRDTVINAIKTLCGHQLIIKIPSGKANTYKINIYDPSQVGISDLKGQVGNSDHNRSEIPTIATKEHTYSTNKDKQTVCIVSDAEAPEKKYQEKIIFPGKRKAVIAITESKLRSELLKHEKDFSEEEIVDAIQKVRVMKKRPELSSGIESYVAGIILRTRKQNEIDKAIVHKRKKEKKASPFDLPESKEEAQKCVRASPEEIAAIWGAAKSKKEEK